MDDNIFADTNFSGCAGMSDPCEERVGYSNSIKEQKKDTMAAKTDIPTTCNFEPSFPVKFERDPRSAGDLAEKVPSVQQHQPMHGVELTSFDFSNEQLKGPVVIEVLCGSARVTASLKEVGLTQSFGVDHVLDKAVSAAKRLDLTQLEDQQLFLQWMSSPLVVGLFLAPPCGTCSLARNIQLRDEKGRKIPGPIPLRSAVWPEGLPGLGAKDRARVSAANTLYDFVAKVVALAHSIGLIVVVENPRSSLFWLTRFWKNIGVPMQYTAHQACAYGGERPKWTVLAWNHPAFSSINRCCPGEGKHHHHKPWGLVKSETGTHFSTSEETAYPRGLAHTIAKVFAEIMTSFGWSPPPEQLTGTEVTLQSMRAAATAQPKASKMPPVVREHKSVVLIQGPHEALCEVPIAPMQRLKDAWQIPAACSSKMKEIPAGAQLLRQTPLRISGGKVILGQQQQQRTQLKFLGQMFLSRLGAFHSVPRSSWKKQ